MSISIIKHKLASDNFTSLDPSLLIFTSLGLTRATQTDRAASKYDLRLPSLLCKRGPLEAPDHSYPACVCVCYISASGVSCPTSQSGGIEEKQQKCYEGLVNGMKVGFCFVRLHCSSCCVYPRGRLRETIPISPKRVTSCFLLL